MFLDLARLGKKTVPHTLFTVNAQNHFYSRPCTQCSIGLKGGVSYTSWNSSILWIPDVNIKKHFAAAVVVLWDHPLYCLAYIRVNCKSETRVRVKNRWGCGLLIHLVECFSCLLSLPSRCTWQQQGTTWAPPSLWCQSAQLACSGCIAAIVWCPLCTLGQRQKGQD